MLVTPLKVFASVRQRPTEESSYPQKLILERQTSPYSTLIVQNTNDDSDAADTTGSKSQFVYTDCQYTTSSDHSIYTEQLEELIYSTMQGYNSTGLFINSRDARFDGIRTNMMKAAVNLLRLQLANENTQRRKTDRPEIKLRYGYIGFCDDCCIDYRSDRMTSNRNAINRPLNTMIEPIDAIDGVLESILSLSHRLPSLLIFHLSDADQFDSTFAWIDARPPISKSDQMHYGKSYSEFESLTKQLCIPKLPSAPLTCQYSMSHLLLDFFSGSYQTVVFAHFEEYGFYSTGLDLDILAYTSQLQYKRCCITRGLSNNIQGATVNNYRARKLQHQVNKLQLLIEDLKSTARGANREYRSEIDNTDYLMTRLVRVKNSAQAAMERQKATTEIQIADMMHQINDFKIELVKTRMVASSLQHTSSDREIFANELQWVNDELCRRRDADAIRMKELEARNKLLLAKLKGADDGDLTNVTELEWLGSEGQYIREIHELKYEKDRLNRDVVALTLERKRMMAEIDSIRLEKDTTISRLQRLHDKEMKSLKESLKQQLKQTIAEKDDEIATMKDDLEFSRSQLQSALLENSTVRQQQQQQQTQTRRSSSILTELRTESKTPTQHEPSSLQNQTQIQAYPKPIVNIDIPTSAPDTAMSDQPLPPKPTNSLKPAQPPVEYSTTTSSATPSDHVSQQQAISNNKRRKLDHLEVYDLD